MGCLKATLASRGQSAGCRTQGKNLRAVGPGVAILRRFPPNSEEANTANFRPEQVLSRQDVIIYADLDDQPVMSGRKGWVSQRHQNLQVRVVQLSENPVSVVKPPDVSGSAEVEAVVLEHAPKAKTVISVLSPPFLQASGEGGPHSGAPPRFDATAERQSAGSDAALPLTIKDGFADHASQMAPNQQGTAVSTSVIRDARCRHPRRASSQDHDGSHDFQDHGSRLRPTHRMNFS